MPQSDPYLPVDDTARALAATLLQQARHAALAVTDPLTHTPNISRIALVCGAGGLILTLISALSAHTAALVATPACAFMVGEPGAKGDPLVHPRLMVQAHATLVERPDPRHAAFRAQWLQHHPKAKLYIDFADFRFVILTPTTAVLNGGFGRTYRLLPADFPP